MVIVCHHLVSTHWNLSAHPSLCFSYPAGAFTSMALMATSPMAGQCFLLHSSISGQPLSGSSHNTTVTLSIASPKQFYPTVYCGRGDKRTAKGKRFKHSFGNARPRDNKKGRGLPITPLPPGAPKKDLFDDGEKIEIEIDESFFGWNDGIYIIVIEYCYFRLKQD